MRKIHNTQRDKDTETEEREGQRDRDRWVGRDPVFGHRYQKLVSTESNQIVAVCPRGGEQARRKSRQKERQGTIYLTFKSVFSFNTEKV